MNQSQPLLEIKEEKKVFHLSADVDYLMGLPNTKLQKLFSTPDGERVPAIEVREFLQDLKEHNILCVPIGANECNNWCNQSGCKGHLKIA